MRKAVTCILIASLVSCQTTGQGFIDKSHYQSSREALKAGRYQRAWRNYPSTSSRYFIPALERAYLALLSGRKADTKNLVRLSQKLEDSKMIHVSDEARRFFLKELDETYVPAEHEIILFHLITGLLFARDGAAEKSCIEARRAAFYLPGAIVDHNDFDDPGIRLMLAALWLHCGDWQGARPNLKKAALLNPRYGWAKALANQQEAPSSFFLALKGVGPEVVWRPDHKDSGRWGLLFVTEEANQSLTIKGAQHDLKIKRGSETSFWYTRHFERDTIPRTLLDDVKHTSHVVIGTAGAVAIGAFAILGATILVATSVAASIAMIAYAGDSRSPALVEAALKLSAYLIAASFALASDTQKAGTAKASDIYADGADESESYRFVRFMPSFIYAGASRNTWQSPKIAGKKPLFSRHQRQTQIHVFHTP